MKQAPTLVLLHGWGFDSSFWNEMCSALSGFHVVRWDRGYFGTPVMQDISGPVIGIGHSLGAMILHALLPDGVELISINGFDRFAGENRTPPRVIARMRSRFAEDPEAVLRDFRARIEASSPPSFFDARRLGADLELLAIGQTEQRQRRVFALHGGRDPLLPFQEEIFPDRPRLTHPDAGHILPVTHPLWCAAAVRRLACV